VVKAHARNPEIGEKTEGRKENHSTRVLFYLKNPTDTSDFLTIRAFLESDRLVKNWGYFQDRKARRLLKVPTLAMVRQKLKVRVTVCPICGADLKSELWVWNSLTKRYEKYEPCFQETGPPGF
jgi:hypothetical protein